MPDFASLTFSEEVTNPKIFLLRIGILTILPFLISLAVK